MAVIPMDNTAPMNREITYPVMPTDYDDDNLNMLSQCLNWQNETIALTHEMVRELWQLYSEKLKPLLDSMPSGLMVPGGPLMPPFPGMQRR